MKKRHNLSRRLILALVGVAIAVMAIATMAGLAILKIKNEEIRLGILYITGLVAVVVALVLFIVVANRLIVRRIRLLNDAVGEVSHGRYDLSLPLKGNDELTELSENFNKMAAELQANAFLSKDFARYVSHEFKTPLSVIRSYAEAVQINSGDNQTNQSMDIIIAETDRLAEMSKTILELCRLDSTTLVEKNDVFSPAEQIRSILLSTQIKWSEKNITIEPLLEEFSITGNSALVFRIWQNLISNAIKFTNENGNIKIELNKGQNELVFIISDDGIGIADDDKDKIFNMFFTGDKSHNKEGSGLGLPLTKRIVEKLEGEITFASERNRGSTFTVRLPL
ncbi:MAG: sensor histidine kinase [Christensenellales bacterium]